MLHAHIPPVPAGKVRLAEYGTTKREEHAIVTLLAEAPSNILPRRTIRLEHATRGWAIAGSVLRWDEEYYAVRFNEPDGTSHGRRFRTEAEARALFARWTEAPEV